MISAEVVLFFAMTLCGIAVSFIFDLLRAVRIGFRLRTLWVMVSDALFCIVSVLAAAGCVWNIGDGKFRFYEIIGLFLGAVFYFSLFSKWILKFFLLVIENILKFTRFILKILLTPPQFLYKILIVPMHGRIGDIRKRGQSSYDKHVSEKNN